MNTLAITGRGGGVRDGEQMERGWVSFGRSEKSRSNG
jgi:hypothetical protein